MKYLDIYWRLTNSTQEVEGKDHCCLNKISLGKILHLYVFSLRSKVLISGRISAKSYYSPSTWLLKKKIQTHSELLNGEAPQARIQGWMTSWKLKVEVGNSRKEENMEVDLQIVHINAYLIWPLKEDSKGPSAGKNWLAQWF